MKKIPVLLLAAVMGLSLSACAAETPPPEEPAGKSAPTAVQSVAAAEPAEEPPPAPEPDYVLHISDQPIPMAEGCLVTDRLPVRFINNTGEEGYVLDIPHLERKNEEGAWEPVPWKEGVGFCGTPSLLPAGGREWSEDLLYLWGPLEEGDYRLSYEVGATFKTEERACGEFTLYMPEDSQGLPLFSGEVFQSGEDAPGQALPSEDTPDPLPIVQAGT